MRLLPLLCLLTACGDKSSGAAASAGTDSGGTDSGPPLVDGCDPSATAGLVIGQGAGSAFFVLEDQAPVGLDVAPQGGFGVSVRALTTGLVADGIVDVLLDVEHNGENVGSFVNEGTNLYCQDDGSGLLWGVVVGFDAENYPTNDDLLAFNGEHVILIVAVTDTDGDTAEGRVEVVIEVGG
jgi:hypothetical protein